MSKQQAAVGTKNWIRMDCSRGKSGYTQMLALRVSKRTTPPITDPHPGATQGEVLIDYHLDSTAPAPTAVPTVQPLELPVEGGHSHVEGGD